VTAPREQIPDHLRPPHSKLELSTLLVIATSLVTLTFALFAVVTGLVELVPGLVSAIRVFALIYVLVVSVWCGAGFWAVEHRGREARE